MPLFDLISLTLYLTSSLLFIYLLITSNFKKKKIIALYIQSEMDKHLLGTRLEEVSKELNSRELMDTDGFIKFISQSRDWAFEYIEEVQEVLSKFDSEISEIIAWNETYGTVTDGGVYSDKIKQISLAYNQLKDLLPKNTETPNN